MASTASLKPAHAGRPWRHVYRVFLLTMVMLSLLAGVPWGVREVAQLQWRHGLDTVPPEKAAGHVALATAWGNDGLRLLAEALGSHRACVAEAAREELESRVRHWRDLPRALALSRLELLAEALAGAQLQYGPNTRRWAADLALQMLAWPRAADDTQSLELLAACEEILAASPRIPGGPRVIGAPRNAGHLSRESSRTIDEASRDVYQALAQLPKVEPAQLTSSLDGLTRTPATPGVTRELPDDNEIDDTRVSSEPLGDDPAAGASVAETTDGNAPARLRPPPKGGSGAPEAPREGDASGSQDEPEALEEGPALLPSNIVSAERSARNAAEEDQIELFRRLHSSREDDAREAVARLEERGYGPVEIELARRLTSPERSVRLQLIEQLPGLAGVDPKRWLMWLTQDPDPTVRSSVIALLATTNDREMLARVEQMSAGDPSPDVRAQASRALVVRHGKRTR